MTPPFLWQLVLLDSLRATCVLMGAVVAIEAGHSLWRGVNYPLRSATQAGVRLSFGLFAVVAGVPIILSDRVNNLARDGMVYSYFLSAAWGFVFIGLGLIIREKATRRVFATVAYSFVFIATMVMAYLERTA